MKSAIIRVDASSILGLGHLMRCVALACQLTEEGFESIFVMKHQPSDICDLVTGYGHKLVLLPPNIDLNVDYQFTRNVTRERSSSLVITDICNSVTHRDIRGLEDYHRNLSSECFVVGIAGDVVFEIPTHVIVAPYVSSGYEGLADSDGRTLLAGSDYVIIREEFKKVGSLERVINERANRILITIGGSDEYQSTNLIVQSMKGIGYRDISLKIVLAAGFSNELCSRVRASCADFLGTTEFLSGDVQMAEEMIWSDLAITGDGITKYETAATGTPSIILSRPESNEAFNLAFEKIGSTKYLGQCTKLDTQILGSEIKKLVDDQETRRRMSVLGKTLVDCKGAERTVKHVLWRLRENQSFPIG